MSQLQQKFDQWCVVELFGHQKIAGHCTEENIAGSNMLRVDVPETKSMPAFTRYLGSAAIYAINPTDELTAKHMAELLEVKPIDSWNISAVMKKYQDNKLLADAAAAEKSMDIIDEKETDPIADAEFEDENTGNNY